MKICTIFTGGTIGSVINQNGYIGPNEKVPYQLLQLYREQFGDEVEFVNMEPYRILSENLHATNVLLLKNAIREALLQEDIQGIVVTHGTDTLQYSAAILGYLFGNSAVPIVLVSSNYVLGDNRANGLVNFRYAVEFIKGNYGTGVFVSYNNKGEFPSVHRATRLQPPVPYSDYVSSVCDNWYGKFENGIYISNSKYDTMNGKSSMFDEVDGVMLDDVSKQILRIHPYVGMYYPNILPETKVILHGSFHSGTICVDEKLRAFAKEASERGIPFYLTGLLTEANAYETVKYYKEMDIIPLQTSAEIAQYCKLWLALSNNLEVQSIMQMSIAEDWIPFLDKMQ